MARAVWPGADPLGKCFYIGSQPDSQKICTTVVGVARDVLPGVTDTEPHQLYYVAPRHRTIGMNAGQMLLVRARGDAAALAPILRELVRSSVPNVRYVEASTLEERVAPQLRSWRLGATLLTVFGLLALLVAAAGLYSVLAFDVAQRRFELGVRSALGASAPRLVRAITGHVLLVTSAGVLLGMASALFLARAAQTMLFRVQPTDPLVYGGAVAAMLIIALFASVLPSWRATRIDPKIALISE
jgi:predicted lysophospholipase L1 biosynthesis ABC-type transport system permease subunit